MKSLAVAMTVSLAVLLGGTTANSSPLKEGLSQATDFSSQHHGGRNRGQHVRPSHDAPRHGQRRIHGTGHGGGHGGGAPGITIGVGGGGHRGGGHGGASGGVHR